MIETAIQQHGHMRISTEDELRRKHRRQKGRSVHDGASGLVVSINHGRWVVHCECGAGCAATPGWPSVCFGCGAVHEDVVFPDDIQGIEAALAPRPEINRNWLANETVADLLMQNKRHGI